MAAKAGAQHAKNHRVHTIDPAIKYCLGAPSFSAPFAEKGGKAMSLFS
jgi:hypothetical protein